MTDTPSLGVEEMSTLERLDRVLDILDSIERGLLATDVNLQEARAAVQNVRRDLDECRRDATPPCVHCGSPLTFRRADGDVGCKDCPGIMPREEVDA